jgi:hypothetical protein
VLTSGVLAVLLAAWSAGGELGLRHEPGVESKMLVTGLADFGLGSRVSLDAGLSFSLFQNSGINVYELGAGVKPLGTERLAIEARVQHQQWSGWQAGENRAFALVRVEPLRRVRLELGAAYRVPLFDGYASPFNWHGDAPEWNYVYGLEWMFLARERFSAAVFLANSGRLTLYNPQQFPFGLSGEWRFSPGWLATARLATAINGFSAALVSFSELDLDVGVVRAF